jgi:hypothetical protein
MGIEFSPPSTDISDILIGIPQDPSEENNINSIAPLGAPISPQGMNSPIQIVSVTPDATVQAIHVAVRDADGALVSDAASTTRGQWLPQNRLLLPKARG